MMTINKFSRVPPQTPDEFVGQAAMAVNQAEQIPMAVPVDQVPLVSLAPLTQTKGTANRQTVKSAPVEVDESVYRTLTLRLTKDRYKTLKMLSTVSETPIQQLLVEALDDFLDKKSRVG
jgi:hypothetical protein